MDLDGLWCAERVEVDEKEVRLLELFGEVRPLLLVLLLLLVLMMESREAASSEYVDESEILVERREWVPRLVDEDKKSSVSLSEIRDGPGTGGSGSDGGLDGGGLRLGVFGVSGVDGR